MEQESPRLATTDDYSAITELIDRVFGHGSGGMEARYPNWFSEDRPERYAVIESDDEIVSTVACIVDTLMIGESEVECARIGHVATGYAHRNNGYMSSLLSFWLEWMKNRSIPIAALGGDRTRYNWFGWESTGAEMRFEITERRLPDAPDRPGEIMAYDGSNSRSNTIKSMYVASPYRVKRSISDIQDILDQYGVETLIYRDKEHTSYISFTQPRAYGSSGPGGVTRRITEFGGSKQGVEILLNDLFSNYDTNKLVLTSDSTNPMNPYFHGICDRWSTVPHRMINILDLETLLIDLKDHLVEKWVNSGHCTSGSVIIDVTNSVNSPVEIAYSAEGIHIKPNSASEPTTSLDSLSTVSLLFDRPGFMTARHDDPFLNTVFPIDFFIPKLE